MKTLFQFFIICLASFVGQLLNYFIPLPVPAGIWGMALLFAMLCTGVLKPKRVEGAADYIVSILPVCFVPATVSIMENLGLLWDNLFVILSCGVAATFLTFLAAGRTSLFIRKKQGLCRPSGKGGHRE